MSYEHAERVYASPLKGGKLLLMLALAHHADKGGGGRPSTYMLAMEARVTDRQVRRLLNELEEDGYIAIEERAIGRGKSPRYQLFPNEKAEEMSAFNGEKVEEMSAFSNEKAEEMSAFSDGKADISEQKADISDRNYSHARSGWVGGSLSTTNTEKKIKPTHPPKPSQPPPLESAQQLALGLLIDPEVGISYEVAQILATSKPLVDIYRLVDDWLPEHRDGGVEAGALVSRIRRVKPSSAQTVSLSAGFRDSDLFHRHRLPDEMIADGRKRYNIAPAQEPRRKYST